MSFAIHVLAALCLVQVITAQNSLAGPLVSENRNTSAELISENLRATGIVYVMNCKELLIEGFTYDPGQMKPQIRFLGLSGTTSIRALDGSGFVITPTNVDARFLALNGTKNKDMKLELLGVETARDISLMYMWDEKLKITIASVEFPKNIRIPAQYVIGGFIETTPVQAVSGEVLLLNSKQIRVSKFSFYADGVSANFYIGDTETPRGQGQIVTADGSINPLQSLNNVDVCIDLSAFVDVSEIKYLAVYDTNTGTSFGYVPLPSNITSGIQLVPAYSDDIDCQVNTEVYACVNQHKFLPTSALPPFFTTDPFGEFGASTGRDFGEFAAADDGYRGVPAGVVQGSSNDAHSVSGKLFFANCYRMVLTEFTLLKPNPNTVIRLEQNKTKVILQRIEEENQDEEIVFSNVIYAGDVLDIYDQEQNKVLAKVTFDRGMDALAPHVHFLGRLSEIAHHVRGLVYVLNSKHILLEHFTYDGKSQGAMFYVGKGIPDERGQAIPDETGMMQPLGEYLSEYVCLTLPEGITIFDIDYISVYDVRVWVNYGSIPVPSLFGNLPANLLGYCDFEVKQTCGFVKVDNTPYGEASGQDGLCKSLSYLSLLPAISFFVWNTINAAY